MLAHAFSIVVRLLALLSIPSALLAFFQYLQAKQSRLAATYMAISKGWDDLVPVRSIIGSVFEERGLTTHAERGALLLDVLDGDLPCSPDETAGTIEDDIQRQNLERGLDTILSYLEDLGLLCRRGYVGKRDVFDIMGSSVVEIVEIMMPYIERERGAFENGETIYANTIWLYRRALSAAQFKVEGYGTPRLFFR